jgi:hypothetical protein
VEQPSIFFELTKILEDDGSHLLSGRTEAPRRKRRPGFPELHNRVLLPLAEQYTDDLDAPFLLLNPELRLLQPERLADPESAQVQDADQGPAPQPEVVPVDAVGQPGLSSSVLSRFSGVVLFDVLQGTSCFRGRSIGTNLALKQYRRVFDACRTAAPLREGVLGARKNQFQRRRRALLREQIVKMDCDRCILGTEHCVVDYGDSPALVRA